MALSFLPTAQLNAAASYSPQAATPPPLLLQHTSLSRSLLPLQGMLFNEDCLVLLSLVSSVGFLSIDCGLEDNSSGYTDADLGIFYVPDGPYIDAGENQKVLAEYVSETLRRPYVTLRSFPTGGRNCYSLPTNSGAKYLVRLVFFYGNYDRKNSSSTLQFDLHLGVNYWDTVHADGDEVYEAVFVAWANWAPVCLVNTGAGTPFVSSVELRPLGTELYGDYVMANQSMAMYQRRNMAASSSLRYPQDRYDRYWWQMHAVSSWANLSTTSTIQMGPTFAVPSSVLQTAVTPTENNTILSVLTWQGTMARDYAVFLHFADFQNSKLRQFDVYPAVGQVLKAYSPSYLSSFSVKTPWLKAISGNYNITFVATAKSVLAPILNAFEIYFLITHDSTTTFFKDGKLACSLSLNKAANIHQHVQRMFELTNRFLLPSHNYLLQGHCLLHQPLQCLHLGHNSIRGYTNRKQVRLSSTQRLNAYIAVGLLPTPQGSHRFLHGIPRARTSLIVTRLGAHNDFTTSRRHRHVTLTSPSHASFATSCRLCHVMPNSLSNAILIALFLDCTKFLQIFHLDLAMSCHQDVSIRPISPCCSPVPPRHPILTSLCNLVKISQKLTCEVVGNVIFLIVDMCYYKGKNNVGDIFNWATRVRVALDAAQGLDYLHKGCNLPIIHGDVKTNNVLLGQNLKAKLADFGLSKTYLSDTQTHISTTAAGTMGYIDPEYYHTGRLTESSDVYSFGIVLLEVATGEPPILHAHGHIVQRVKQKVSSGNISLVADARLRGSYDVSSMWKVVDIALVCTTDVATQRPTMATVVAQLKESLALEEAREDMGGITASSVSDAVDVVSMFGPSAR
ncbi:hypothetical protein ABZP36_035719 [Zizania latifolia]